MVDLDQPFTPHSGYCSQSFTILVGQISANLDNFHLAHIADFCPMGLNLMGDKKLRDSLVGNMWCLFCFFVIFREKVSTY